MTDKISIMSPEIIDIKEDIIKAGVYYPDLNNQNATKSVQVSTGKIIQYWDKDYIVQKLSEIEDKKHKMFFTFLWMTGLRVSESCTIKKSFLDLKEHTANVRWLKNRKANFRVIPLHPNLVQLLDYYIGGFKSDDFIFPWSRKQAWTLSKRYFGGKTHCFRHSFAVNCIKNGLGIDEVCQLLGHKDIRNTMIYTEICPRDLGSRLQKVTFR